MVKNSGKVEPGRPLDRIDRRILRILEQDGRISNVDLARRVHLSPTPCLERVRRLEREGYILGYHARLNPELLDTGLILLVEVSLRNTADAFKSFRAAILEIPEVLECHLVAGNFDYLLKLRVPDIQAYRLTLSERLTTIPAVAQVHSYVVMESVKEAHGLPRVE